jgi:RNA polymerase sigma-70 factor (ECF subfamily)
VDPRLDDAALERLYVRLEKPLYSVVYRWVWQADEARDVVQDAFLRLWRMRARIDLATVEPLVYRIAINLAANRRRSKKLWRWVSADALSEHGSDGEGADAVLAGVARASAIRDAVESLPEKQRQVVLLCEVAQMTYDAVAAVLQIPVGTVASRRNKAMKLLEDRLGSLAEGGADAVAR